MNRTLRIWIKDTVAAEMRFSYRRIQALPFEYDFIPRYADFYGKSPLARMAVHIYYITFASVIKTVC